MQKYILEFSVMLLIIFVVLLLIYAIYVSRQIKTQGKILHYIESFVNNRIEMRESLLRKVMKSKSDLLKELKEIAILPTMNISNAARELRDRANSTQFNKEETDIIVNRILSDAEDLSRYFKNIVDVARYVEGKLFVDIGKNDLKHFLRIIAQTYQLKYNFTNQIVIKFQILEGVYFDPFKMEQLFCNIFGNIARNSNDPRITISVSKSEIDFIDDIVDAALIVIKVHDTKLSEKDLKVFGSQMIFDIVAEFHYAKIWTETLSEMESSRKNITFNILLPIVGRHPGRHTKVFNLSSFEENMMDRFQREILSFEVIKREYDLMHFPMKYMDYNTKILFIDENHTIREYAELTLAKMGCDLKILGSYKEAMITIEGCPQNYHIVVMDIFSETYGSEVVQLLYKICQNNNVAVIFHVGYTDDRHIDTLKNDNTYFILKPYSILELQNMIVKIMST
jgi:CheY-like chemotaxis protein